MSRSREKGWERKRKGKGVEQEQEQGQGQRREQGREPGREPGQEQAGQAAGGGLFVCARKGAGDHQMRGGWGPSSHLVCLLVLTFFEWPFCSFLLFQAGPGGARRRVVIS